MGSRTGKEYVVERVSETDGGGHATGYLRWDDYAIPEWDRREHANRMSYAEACTTCMVLSLNPEQNERATFYPVER